MSLVTVIGTQWGDEGKGKIVDLLADKADCIVRFQGGHNAGHTLVINGTSYKLSLLPSGIVRDNTMSYIGNGVVVDPFHLLKEIDIIGAQGLKVTPDNLVLSESAHLILPVHQRLDNAMEQARGNAKIGTTGRGIGPAYEDKVARHGIRVCDLRDKTTLKSKIESLMFAHNARLRGLGLEEMDANTIYSDLVTIADKILPFAGNVWHALEKADREGKNILFEGAQGSLLDIDHGTYPFVTSSNTVASQAAAGSGLGKARHAHIVGLAKAYTTRVGSGPFPTEQENEIGEYLGQKGHEFGTVTGRKRRCGWFDAVLVKQIATITGLDSIALTKLDVLDGLSEIKICVGYTLNGEKIDYLPALTAEWDHVEPVYETLDGWQEETAGIRNYDDLPANCRAYVERIEHLVGAPISIISISPERDDTIIRQNVFA